MGFGRSLLDFLALLGRQITLIVPYWISGILLSSILLVYARAPLEKTALKLQSSGSSASLPLLKHLAAVFLGAASPITLHGVVPLILAMAAAGTPPSILAAFAVSSLLINPTILIYSLALGPSMAAVRLLSALTAGLLAGALTRFFRGWGTPFSPDFASQPQPFRPRGREGGKQLLRQLFRGIRKTGPNLGLGILLTALFIKFFPPEIFYFLFQKNQGLGVLYAAGMGGPLYFCGGGTIPLLRTWLESGLSPGAAAAFMVTGPATKLNNLAAVRNLTTPRAFPAYLLFIIPFGILAGLAVNTFFAYLGLGGSP